MAAVAALVMITLIIHLFIKVKMVVQEAVAALVLAIEIQA